MKATVVAIIRYCNELFPILDTLSTLGNIVHISTGVTQLNVSIYMDSTGAHILAVTLPL